MIFQSLLALKYRNAINFKEGVESENKWFEDHGGVHTDEQRELAGNRPMRHATLFERKMNIGNEEITKM